MTAPLELRRDPAGSGAGWRSEHWRFRGWRDDEVHGDLTLPAGEPWGIVLAAHGMGGARDAPYIQGAARAWARDGLAVLSVDAPHHGSRAQEAAVPPAPTAPLFAEAVGDLVRALDALDEAGLGGIPTGFLGFSMGAITGTALLASGTRIRAAVLVVVGSTVVSGHATGAGEEASAFDPARNARSAPDVAVLMMNADRDEIFDREAAFALYDAFPGRKQIVFFPGTHGEWSEPALRYRTMLAFLRAELTP